MIGCFLDHCKLIRSRRWLKLTVICSILFLSCLLLLLYAAQPFCRDFRQSVRSTFSRPGRVLERQLFVHPSTTAGRLGVKGTDRFGRHDLWSIPGIVRGLVITTVMDIAPTYLLKTGVIPYLSLLTNWDEPPSAGGTTFSGWCFGTFFIFR